MPESTAPLTIVSQLVETMRTLDGTPAGFRSAHAKGLVCAGIFRPTVEASSITRAPHMQGNPVPTILRFSNANGCPYVHDGKPNVRAMSVKFQLAEGKSTDILANSIDGFVARTPEEFLEFLQAQLPDATTGVPGAGVPKFLASHPATAAFIGRFMQKPVPASYAQTSYHAEHAFLFTAADGSQRFGRYHFIPEAGEAALSPDSAGQLSQDFLRDELAGRLRAGPVVFRLQLQVAAANDPTDDPTALWPPDRMRVDLGRLEVTSMSSTSAQDERQLIFDPTNLADGIDLSKDPILLARSSAYSISYERRSKGE
jgi:catalase